MARPLVEKWIDPARALATPEWLDVLEDIAEEHGYFEPLGPDHSAIFLDQKPMLLVTFETMASIRARAHSDVPLGWTLAEADGWSQLCLLSHDETWFRHRAVYEYFDRLVDDGFFEGYDRVVFCGADSCGYAAAAFSVVSPGATVITMSPQATLDPSVAQWDDRFLHKRRTNFTDRYGYAPDMLEAAAHAFVIYDPEVEPDAMHAALFHGSNISRIRFRHLGGQVDTFLNRMELLAPLVSRAMAGTLAVADFYAAYRERRNYLPYLRMFLGAVQQAERPFLSAMLCTSVLSRMNVPRFRQQLNASTKELQAAGKALPRAVALQSA